MHVAHALQSVIQEMTRDQLSVAYIDLPFLQGETMHLVSLELGKVHAHVSYQPT